LAGKYDLRCVCVCGGGYVCAHVCVHILYNLFQLTVSYLVRDSEP